MAAIPYWGFYASGNPLTSDPNQSGTGQQFLRALQQYDPSASFVQHASPYEGDGAGGPAQWSLQYDASKLPGGGFPNAVDLNPDTYAPLYGDTKGHGAQGTVNNPSGVTNSPVYGQTTPTSNFTWAKTNNLDDILGPLGVLGFAFGAPFLASAMSGGAIGGTAATGLLDAGQAAAPITDLSTNAATDAATAAGADAPLGSAESSLFGPDALTSPASALTGAAPITDLSTQAGIGDTLRNLLPPGVSNALSALSKIPGALAGATGGGAPSGPGGGGLGLLSPPGGPNDSMGLLKSFYAPKIATPRAQAMPQQGLLDPRLMALMQGMRYG